MMQVEKFKQQVFKVVLHEMFDNEAEKTLETSRNKLCIHNKLKLQIDKNDELACWVIICR